jgi:predicted nucleotidyltransferase
MMHLDKEQRTEVLEILKRHLPDDVRVFAFGSRVTGRNLKRFSDLDLCLRSGQPISASVLARLGTDFEVSQLPFKVDVVDWAELSSEFRDAIAYDLEPLAWRST